MPSPPGSNTKWVDGLRGIASLLVVTAHIIRSLAPWIVAPSVAEYGGTVLFQLPILRDFAIGRPSVAVFALLSGFVISLKPIRQTRAGQVDAALSGVAKAAYRRVWRLILPATFATLMSWVLCQLGAYQIGRVGDSSWIRSISPAPKKTIFLSFLDLLKNLRMTWTSAINEYEMVQWMLTHLLRGSMLVYLTLTATAFVEPNWRYLIYVVLYSYQYASRDGIIGINIYMGMIMAELNFTPQVHQYVEKRPNTFGILSTALILLGFVCNSFPEMHAEWAAWSRSMIELGKVIFPGGAEMSRFYSGLGAQMICLGVMFNSTAKSFLSSPWPCWLGKLSWPVYLIHPTLIRTLFSYILYGLSTRPPSPGKDKNGVLMPRPWTPIYSNASVFIAIPIFYFALYRLAQVWASHVDPLCDRISNWVEYKMFRSEETSEKTFQPV